MVDKFKEILAKILIDKKSITMFAAMKMDDLTDKWTIVFSAPWITESARKEDFEYVRNLVISIIKNEEERASIARIGIFPGTAPLILSLLQYKENTVVDEDVKINGNIIHHAYILASNPPLIEPKTKA